MSDRISQETASDAALWSADLSRAIDEAITGALAGQPRTVVVEGDPGQGKSTFLDEMCARAAGFTQLCADSVPGSSSPYQGLHQWGLSTEPSVQPYLAAQQLRELLDRHDRVGPVLIRLDDLQWADPESVEALGWVVRKAAGDRLLVVIGSRPLTVEQHPNWQRWMRASPTVRRIRLDGVGQQVGRQIIERYRPGLPASTAQALLAHTGGNPLYLTGLLQEYCVDDVTRMRVLPAPSAFEELTVNRLGRLLTDATNLARAAAVTGSGWVELPILAAVAEITGDHNITEAADEAVQAGLLELKTTDGTPAVRPAHALVRSAVYYATPLTQRRHMHLRAATHAADPTSRLEHRVTATASFDDDLANELDAKARTLHAQRSFRLAGQYLDWAATTTSDPARRRRRRLDALCEARLVGDRAAVPAELEGGGVESEQLRVLLIRGLDAVLDGLPELAVTLLSEAIALPVEDGDPIPIWRANFWLAWAHLQTGSDQQTILDDVERADRLGDGDPLFAAYLTQIRDTALARSSTPEELLARVASLPERVSEVSNDQRVLLVWRGQMRLHAGLVSKGLDDLREAHQRIVRGDANLNTWDDVEVSRLGFAYWTHGQWDRAKLLFDLVAQIAPHPAPNARLFAVLLPAGQGDADHADAEIAEITGLLERRPWQEVVQQLLVLRVVHAHASGSRQERTELLPEMHRRFGPALSDSGLVSSWWFMHAALAGIWANDRNWTQPLIAQLEHPDRQAQWSSAAAHWIRGLRAERDGDHRQALTHLHAAAEGPTEEIPFYRAHMFTDHARLAERAGLQVAAAASRATAQQIYRTLGARSYLEDPAPSSVPAAAPAPGYQTVPAQLNAAGLAARFGLSEREEAVAVLVADGMTYAEVARELFVTRSTVGFHLGNIYAKVGVSSRHQLRQLARSSTG